MVACADCGYSSPKWFGRCPQCDSWSSAAQTPRSSDRLEPVCLSGIAAVPPRIVSGIGEVDRVLGGGFVPGEVVLLAGEPGIGKSTLVLQLVDALVSGGHEALLVTGEESVDQIALRAARLDIGLGGQSVAASTSMEAIVGALYEKRAGVIVVDSIQSVAGGADHPAGSAQQIRSCAAEIVRAAKETDTAVTLVGHVTKDGSISGPKVLEHLVDAVLTLDGERHGAIRVLRASKNRFGSCEEVGVFVMAHGGLEPVADPSAMLLADRHPEVSGSVVFPSLEGTRPLLVELQSLVAHVDAPNPRRVALGLDARRVALMLGVLSSRARLDLARHDVFVAAAGGIAVREPAADVALCLALGSALSGRAVPPGLVAIGEIGLAGELRRVPGMTRRLSEAARLGFTCALVPEGVSDVPEGFEVLAASDLSAALALAGCVEPSARR